ncbi:MAG: macro domain-containing protein [Candidatus Hermodarchaeia archaeon]|jgi:O-acetyl-ADP-ribose deacetylase (regulator of RNase III)
MRRVINKVTIELVQGDITDLATDAIVNAANESLQMGGGVAGAIRRRGGPAIQRECDDIGGTSVGTAVLTTGGNLKARYVIHAVGPRWGEGGEDQKLANAVSNALKLADKKRLRSLAIPAISTGIFGFPKERAAKIILQITIAYVREANTTLRRIVFCLFDPASYDIFEGTFNGLISE